MLLIGEYSRRACSLVQGKQRREKAALVAPQEGARYPKTMENERFKRSLLLGSGVALRLLVTAGSNGEVTLVARGVGGVGTLVVLDVARTAEGRSERDEAVIVLDDEVAAARGHGRRSDATNYGGMSMRST